MEESNCALAALTWGPATQGPCSPQPGLAAPHLLSTPWARTSSQHPHGSEASRRHTSPRSGSVRLSLACPAPAKPSVHTSNHPFLTASRACLKLASPRFTSTILTRRGGSVRGVSGGRGQGVDAGPLCPFPPSTPDPRPSAPVPATAAAVLTLRGSRQASRPQSKAVTRMMLVRQVAHGPSTWALMARTQLSPTASPDGAGSAGFPGACPSWVGSLGVCWHLVGLSVPL